MPQILDLKAKGLYTFPNQLGSVPQGALLKADNVVIDREGTTETRRGFKQYGTVLANAPKKLFNYEKKLIVHHGTTLSYDTDDAGTWADYSGTYSPPTGAAQIRSIQENLNFYFTTSAGIGKLDSITGAIEASGMPKGLDGTGAVDAVAGWFTDSTQVAYRVLFGKSDANNNKILGAPSARIVVGNTSGTSKNVDVTFTLPTGLSTSHFYQLYRSAESAGIASEPDDELQLIVERNFTGGEISAGTVTYNDQTPQSLRGATLYTSPSQQGILQANDQPPLARDIANYKDVTLYAYTISKQRKTMTMISVGAPNGIQVDDTVAIAGVTYTGKAAEAVGSDQFLVYLAGNPAENIDTTARSLVRVINQSASTTLVYAYYLTGFNDLPGQILIEERSLGGSSFAITTSRASAWNPSIPTSGTSYSSDNEESPNRVYISKKDQPEAVPILNYVLVGSKNKAILRIIALRDSVFILKEDGVFRITGETIADFRVALFDRTTTLLAEESAVNFNNQVFAMGDQGIVSISDSGIAIESRSIEGDILKITAEQYTNFAAVSFGVSYESDRKYIFFTVTDEADTQPTQAYVHNSLTSSITRWPLTRSCGLVNTRDNKLYLGDPSSKFIYQERKSFTISDYAEEEVALTIGSSSGTDITVSSSTGVAVGDSVAQFVSGSLVRSAVVTDVPDPTSIIVDRIFSWTAGAATAYKPILTAVKYVPIHGGNPSLIHHWNYLECMFSDARFNALTATFTTDMSQSEEDVVLIPKFLGPWGLFPWGPLGWGLLSSEIQPIPTYVPREKARSSWLNLELSTNQALTKFSLVGIAVFFELMSYKRR